MLDWLFTPQCAACTIPAEPPLCEGCRLSLVGSDDKAVIAPIDVVAPWRFGGSLATTIRRLKFTGKTHVARDLAPLWAPILAAIARDRDEPLVVPVPLHWRRRFTRGFDQAWLLARYACEAAGLPPPSPVMDRTRYAPPQSTLPLDERGVNLVGAFVARRAAVEDRDIILVDDVVTSGATLSAASSALVRAGARSVIGLALARTP